jgi:hypothetical protein
MMQLLTGFFPMQRVYREYYFVPIAFGTISDYFRDGEPNEMLKDGWEVHSFTAEGVLFRR